MSWAAAIGAAGAIGGALISKSGSGGSQTTSREPWEPAQGPMTRSLTRGQALEDYYQQNPFNPQQQTGYQNLFGTIDAANQSLPGLLNFANMMMGQRYQRQSGGAPGSYAGYSTSSRPGNANGPMSQGNPFSGGPMNSQANRGFEGPGPSGWEMPANVPPGGLLGQFQSRAGNANSPGYTPSGILNSGANPFVAPQTRAFGQINWQAQNPWNSAGVQAALAPPAKEDKPAEQSGPVGYNDPWLGWVSGYPR